MVLLPRMPRRAKAINPPNSAQNSQRDEEAVASSVVAASVEGCKRVFGPHLGDGNEPESDLHVAVGTD